MLFISAVGDEGERQPTVLKNWYVLNQRQTGSDGLICMVEGTLPNGICYHSSPIVERLSQTDVRTASGTVYRLQGKMRRNLPNKPRIACFLPDCFDNGFPVDWRLYFELPNKHDVARALPRGAEVVQL